MVTFIWFKLWKGKYHEVCPDNSPDHFSSKQLQTPANFVIDCRNQIVNSALENEYFSRNCNETIATSVTDYLSSLLSNEDISLLSSETSDLESKTELKTVLESETDETAVSRDNKLTFLHQHHRPCQSCHWQFWNGEGGYCRRAAKWIGYTSWHNVIEVAWVIFCRRRNKFYTKNLYAWGNKGKVNLQQLYLR